MIIPFHKPFITQDEIDAVIECLESGWITMGEKTIEFENDFAKYMNMPHAVSFNSCTAAMHCALKAIGLSEGDEVIIPDITFVSTAEVVTYFGAIPIFADVDQNTHCISCIDIEKKITSKTKAIIPVHYAGQPCDMKEIMKLARHYNLFVIEDAAHALPAWYDEKLIGTIGDITCYSFYATKTLTTGEGGMAVTRNQEWADKMRILRLHGISKDAWKRYRVDGSWEYDVTESGYKYNTTDMNAAMGIEQLKRITKLHELRSEIAIKYTEAFDSYDLLIPYKIKQGRISSWHLYPLKIEIDVLNISRNELIIELKKLGISTSMHFIPLHRFSYYKDTEYGQYKYPNSEWVYQREISLPIYPTMTDLEVNYVIENVLELIKTYRK